MRLPLTINSGHSQKTLADGSPRFAGSRYNRICAPYDCAVKNMSSTVPARFTNASLLSCRLLTVPSMEPEIDCKMQSNSRYMLWASTCAIAASVVLLASCSVFQPVIDVVPVGSLQQGVVFYLGDTFRQRQEFTVTAVTVLEEQSDSSTRAIWILEGGQEGGQRLRYITYGAKYPDLKESQRPLRLRRGKRYEVFVYTSTGAKSVDVFAFRVDENGNVRQVPWLII